MEHYDAELPPACEKWLAIDEGERLMLVEAYHRDARIRMPKSRRTVHASIHVIVENQLAEKDEVVVRALDRLMSDGLSRHDAVRAIGSVVAKEIYDVVKASQAPDSTHARYYAEIERLTAASWLAEYSD